MIKKYSNLLSKFFHGFIELTESIGLRDYLDHSFLCGNSFSERSKMLHWKFILLSIIAVLFPLAQITSKSFLIKFFF